MSSLVRKRTHRFDVFGRHVAVEASDSGWVVYYPGDDGKRRRATDIVVPSNVSDSELPIYLADLCHEWATERHPVVSKLDRL